MAWIADLLTGVRGLIAFALIASLASGFLKTSAALVALAWITDNLDGRIARKSERETRFADRDLDVDTMVGAGILVGVVLGGYAGTWLVWGSLLLLGVPYVLLRRPTLSMLLQAVAYAIHLRLLWTEAREVFWVPVLAIGAILIIDFDRFRTVTLPTFFGGFRELLPQRGGDEQ